MDAQAREQHLAICSWPQPKQYSDSNFGLPLAVAPLIRRQACFSLAARALRGKRELTNYLAEVPTP